MLKIVAFLLVALALSEARFMRDFSPQEELVETKWMDRKVPENFGRIVLGEPANIADFPYMLVLLDLTRGGFRCGASAVSLHWSLSAAHCTDIGTPPSQVNLRGGSTNRGSGGFIFFVQQYWNHPLYGNPNNLRRLDYDISILQTQSDSPMQGLHVAPVALPPNCASGVCCGICGGTPLIVTGWGRTETGSTSMTLMQLAAPVHDHADCNRIWGRIGPSFFCKAVVNGRDTCNGDSGGPLVTGSGASRVQHGVVSFGTATCGAGSPSVNARIEHPVIRDWIRGLSGI